MMADHAVTCSIDIAYTKSRGVVVESGGISKIYSEVEIIRRNEQDDCVGRWLVITKMTPPPLLTLHIRRRISSESNLRFYPGQ